MTGAGEQVEMSVDGFTKGLFIIEFIAIGNLSELDNSSKEHPLLWNVVDSMNGIAKLIRKTQQLLQRNLLVRRVVPRQWLHGLL